MAAFYPSDIPDLQTMLTSLQNNIPPLRQLVVAISFLCGILFLIRGVYKLKEYGELRTMMSAQTNIFKPSIYLFVGASLLYFPSTYSMSLETFFAQPYPSDLAYNASSADGWQAIISIVTSLIKLIGLIAFVRGWILMSALGGHSAQPGTFGKAMWHLIGGILAINIIGTTNVIDNTLGFVTS